MQNTCQAHTKHVGNTLIACLCYLCALLCILVFQLCSQTMCCQRRMRTLLLLRTLTERIIMVSTFEIQHIRDTSRTHLQGLFHYNYTDTMATLLCVPMCCRKHILCSRYTFAKCTGNFQRKTKSRKKNKFKEK